MALTKRAMTVSVTLVAVLAIGSALLVTDTTGAYLELAPVFVGAALALVLVLAFRSRSRRNRG